MSLKDSVFWQPHRAAASIEPLSGPRPRPCATSFAATAPPSGGEFLRGPVPRSDLGVADHPPSAAAVLRSLLTLGRKLVPLRPETLDLLPDPCRRCVF